MSEGIEVIGYIRASADGKPEWSDDCVCEDAVYPTYDGDESVSMPICRLSDAEAIIAQQAARIAELEQQRSAVVPALMSALESVVHDERVPNAVSQECAAVLIEARRLNPPGECVEYGDAYQGAREDLAIWKRRALEAEEKVRHQDQIIDHLTLEAQGETRFGEPVVGECVAVPRELMERAFQDCAFLPLEDTFRRNLDRNAAVRDIRAILAQQGKAVGDE